MPQSYFEIFNLEPRFALPLERLDSTYRSLAAQVHPDRFANAAPSEQRQALSLATNVNEAYRVLRRPLLRAQYLLNLRGLNPIEDAPPLPPDFLIEQMDWREVLNEAQVHQCAVELLLELERHLDGNSLDGSGNNSAAAQSVQQLMFIDKLLLDIDEARALLEA